MSHRYARGLFAALVSILIAATLVGPTGASASPPSSDAAPAAPKGFVFATKSEPGWRLSWQASRGATKYLVTPVWTNKTLTTTKTGIDLPAPNTQQQAMSVRLAVKVVAVNAKGRRSPEARAITPCAPVYVHAIRGSGQPMGPGKQGVAFTNKVRAIMGLNATRVQLTYLTYRAVEAEVGTTVFDFWNYDGYSESVDHGRDLLRVWFKAARETCPNSKFIPFGYSQGADILGDVLNEKGSKPVLPNITKAVLLADPARNGKERSAVQMPYILGGAGALSARAKFVDGVWQKVHSWCDKKDRVCKRGAGRSHHGTEPTGYLVECSAWWAGAVTLRAMGSDRKITPLPKKCNVKP